MGAVKMHRNASLPAPGTMAADQVRFVKVGSSYIQYVIDNSGVAVPPAVMAHTHNISDVTGLQTALDGKSDTSHVHANATITVAGFMSAADKSKLDGLSNYTHPSSGVTAGTYRSVTVDAMGHVTAGTNPNTLAGYGITQKFVSLDPADGFATPVQSSYDLNTAALTACGYATTATNRPTGAAANGYFSTNAIDSTSFFQTFANPTVQDAYFYRRRNTSTNYAWLQVASREWVATQISGTTGRIGKFTGANTIGDSLLSESGIGIIANGGVFVSDVPHNSNIRGFSLWASGLNRWVFGKAGTESGADSGSDYVMWCYNDAGAFLREPMRISRATGNVTFSGTLTVSGGNSTQWNAAVPNSRTITINGTTFDLTANRSWTVAGGVGGSGTNGFVTKWNGANLADSSIDDSDANFIKTPKGATIGQGGSRWHFQLYPSTTNALLYWNDPTTNAAWVANANDASFDFVRFGVGYILSLWNNQNVEIYKQLKMSVSTGTAPFQIYSTTNVANLNADMLDDLHASSFVQTSRTLTINGTTFDLSANRSWTVTGGIGGSATAGRIPKMATSTTIADSLLSESGIAIIANGGVFVSDVAHNSNVRGYSLWASGVNRWVFGKAGSETGSDAGSDFVFWSYSDSGTFLREPMRLSRATGAVTFSGTVTASGGSSTNWNSAYSWGNHASAGYISSSRSVITVDSIQGGGALSSDRTLSLVGDTTFPGVNKYYGTDGSGNKGWYSLPSGGGGVSGSGSSGYLAMWNGSGSITNGSIFDFGSYMVIYDPLIFNAPPILFKGTQSERLGYSIIGIGTLWYQTDGTQGIYYTNTGGAWVYLG